MKLATDSWNLRNSQLLRGIYETRKFFVEFNETRKLFVEFTKFPTAPWNL